MRPTVDVQKIREYAGHSGSIYARALTPDERYLFTSGDDGIVAQWELEDDAGDAQALLRISNAVYALCHLPDRNLVIAGASEGSVYVIDLSAKKVIHTFSKTRDAIYGIYFHPHTSTLWILHGNGFLTVLDSNDFSEKAFIRIADNHLRAWTPLPGPDQRVAIGTSDHRILIVDSREITLFRQWKAHENSVFSLAIHPAGKYLLSGSRDAHLKAWDLSVIEESDEPALITSLPAHNFTINDFAISPSGDHFVTASRDKTIKIWDAYDFRLLKVVDYARNEGHQHSVNKISWLKSDNSVISCGDDRRIIRWQFDIEQAAEDIPDT